MFTTEASQQTTASPATVWATLVDVAAWPQWYPGYLSADAEGDLELGRRGTVTLLDGRRRPYEIFDWQPGALLSYGTQVPGAALRFHYSVEPAAMGSRISLAYTLRGPSSPIFGRIFGRTVAGYLPEAAERLAGVAESRSGG
ncbi:SRPBCC family protein [Arthrobacter sp. HY1533]|uniref:SRPBCC family protein n=1 Tax=Arthrobacter sp. HY1533 TaxID=2970919 RepID=UPI003FA46292